MTDARATPVLSALCLKGEPDRFHPRPILLKRLFHPGRDWAAERPTVGFPLPMKFVLDYADDTLIFYQSDRQGRRGAELGRVPRSDVTSAEPTIAGPLPALAIQVRGEAKPMKIVIGRGAAEMEDNARRFAEALGYPPSG